MATLIHMTKLQAGTTKQNSPDRHHGLTNSVADSLIKGFKLCVPLVYGSILLHSFRPEHAFLSQQLSCIQTKL